MKRVLSRYLVPCLSILAVAGAYAYRSSERYIIKVSDGTSVSVKNLSAGLVQDLTTGVVGALPLVKPYTLLVFLSPADCSTCLAQTPVWDGLAEENRERLDVVGVVIRSSADEARQYRDAYNPRFRLYHDRDDRLPGILNLPAKTPFKVLVDKRGVPVLADEAGVDDSAFGDAVAGVVSR